MGGDPSWDMFRIKKKKRGHVTTLMETFMEWVWQNVQPRRRKAE